MSFFNHIFQNKVDKYLRCDKYFNPMNSPDSLIKTLKSEQECKYLQKQLNSKTSNIFKLFKRLSVCSILLIHSNKFYNLVSEIAIIESGNKWVDSEFILPYHKFLKKICASSEMYEKTKRHSPLNGEKNIELLFYNIGLLKLLFVIVNKMPLLGRYYKPKNDNVVSNFINTLAVHAQRIYVSFRIVLCHIIEHAKTLLPTREHQIIMKSILCDELPVINEEMKKLFLDKYFYPLSKGIGLKLFKPDEQSQLNSKTIKGIINDHQDTNRQKQKYQLEITLFPGPGRVNLKFYEQSLMSSLQIYQDDPKNFEEQLADIDIDNDQMNQNSPELSKGFKNHSIDSHQKKMISQNEIETGIQRQVESLKQI